jgi:hypothetical protein
VRAYAQWLVADPAGGGLDGFVTTSDALHFLVGAARLPRDLTSEDWQRPEAWYYWKRPQES